jgi:NAD(P)H-dependent FMN reductase
MEKSAPLPPLVILGSARAAGDTSRLVNVLFAEQEIQVLDLLDHPIYPYSYEGSYPATDCFDQVVAQLLKHPLLIFATPVYWYSMSGLMKNFFDRLTDLVTIEKRKGRQLQRKKVLLLAVGSDEELPEGFEVPFRRTAEYLDMEYLGHFYSSKQGLAAAAKQGVPLLQKLLAEYYKS